MATPCARLHFVREPVRNGGGGRPLNRSLERMKNHHGTPKEDPGNWQQPPFEWRRAWWGAAAGVAIVLVAQLLDGSPWWWLAVPFAAVFAGLPFGGPNPNMTGD